jgi:hypothetical protein
MRINYDRAGMFWHGFGRRSGHHWYDLGIIAVDFYAPGGPARMVIYFWKLEIEIL